MAGKRTLRSRTRLGRRGLSGSVGAGETAGDAEAIGREIKQRILEGTRLTASVGIGPNRLITKLGSEHRKPDGLTLVTPDEILDFLAPMPVASLRGVGQQTQKVISRLGVRTEAQLRAIPLYYLEKQLGRKAATSFHNQAFGKECCRLEARGRLTSENLGKHPMM